MLRAAYNFFMWGYRLRDDNFEFVSTKAAKKFVENLLFPAFYMQCSASYQYQISIADV